MKKSILSLSTVSSAVLFCVIGCSSDDGPVQPKPKPAPRVVVTAGTAAPSLTSVNDPLWNGAAETSLDISTLIAPKRMARGGTSLSDSIFVKGIRYNDSLYLRLRWSDATHNVLKDPFSVVTAGPPANWTHDAVSFKEDHLLVMFSGLSGGDWDTWHWRSLTTAYAFVAEGQSFDGTTLTADLNNSSFQAAFENAGFLGTQQPSFVHKDTSQFSGTLFYYVDRLGISNASNSSGWTVGQQIPGWMIDTTLYKRPITERLSRWDIRAAFDYSASQYTVVMCRAMNTGNTDDVNLVPLDSVQFRIGLLDNSDDLSTGGSRRGFTGTFWMIL